jgi:HEXXH motif-containing protein
MMSNLAERVESLLRTLSTNLWLPGLTAELVEAGWRDLYRNSGLTPDTYGTARAIAREPRGPRRVVAHLPVFSGGEELVGKFQIETLDDVFARGYEQSGVKFYSAEELVAVNALEQLNYAINVLKTVPTLLTTVAAIVRTIHVIDPDDDDYDISFSEPNVPFSIFVSLPLGRDITTPLRVAEAIVHEAMHLQLSFIERVLPLVKLTSHQYYSPWREEFRSAQGLLHGLYVFCVISEFLQAVRSSLKVNVRDHVDNRLLDIRRRVNCVESFQNSADLTEIGAQFIQRMVEGIQQLKTY